MRNGKCLFSGLDACSMGHNCQHTCVNSGNSFYCTCRVGYVLNMDKKTCSRKTFRCLFVLLPLWGSGPLWFSTMDQELMWNFSFWSNSPSTLVTNSLCFCVLFLCFVSPTFPHNCILTYYTTYIATIDRKIGKVGYMGHT